MNWKSIIKVASLFILAMILGAMLMAWVVHGRVKKFHESRDGKGFSEHIIKCSGITGNEKMELEKVLDNYGNEMKAIHETFDEKKKEIFQRMKAEGSMVLNNENKEKFIQAVDQIGRHKIGKRKRGKH